MRKVSPLVHVAAWDKEELAAAEAVPTFPDDFIDVDTSYVNASGGLIAPGAITNALIPLFQRYDYGRIVFDRPVLGEGSDPLALLEVEVYAVLAQGIPFVVGVSQATAGGTLPAVEFPIAGHQQFAVRVSALGFDGGGEEGAGEVSIRAGIQAGYKDSRDLA